MFGQQTLQRRVMAGTSCQNPLQNPLTKKKILINNFNIQKERWGGGTNENFALGPGWVRTMKVSIE